MRSILQKFPLRGVRILQARQEGVQRTHQRVDFDGHLVQIDRGEILAGTVGKLRLQVIQRCQAGGDSVAYDGSDGGEYQKNGQTEAEQQVANGRTALAQCFGDRDVDALPVDDRVETHPAYRLITEVGVKERNSRPTGGGFIARRGLPRRCRRVAPGNLGRRQIGVAGDDSAEVVAYPEIDVVHRVGAQEGVCLRRQGDGDFTVFHPGTVGDAVCQVRQTLVVGTADHFLGRSIAEHATRQQGGGDRQYQRSQQAAPETGPRPPCRRADLAARCARMASASCLAGVSGWHRAAS